MSEGIEEAEIKRRATNQVLQNVPLLHVAIMRLEELSRARDKAERDVCHLLKSIHHGRRTIERRNFGDICCSADPADVDHVLRLVKGQSEAWLRTMCDGLAPEFERWRRTRKRFLANHPHCARCDDDSTAATEVYITEPHDGDPELYWNESNWLALCAPCLALRKFTGE